MAAAEELPDPVAGQLLDVAREAFTQGLQVTAFASTVIAAGMAVLAAVALRRAGATPAQPEDSTAADEAVEPVRP